MTESDNDEMDSFLEDLDVKLINDDIFQLEEEQSEQYEKFLLDNTHTIRKSLYILKCELTQVDRNIKNIFDTIEIRKQRLQNWHGFEDSEEEGKESDEEDSDIDETNEPITPSFQSFEIPPGDPKLYCQLKDQLLNQMTADKKTQEEKMNDLDKKLQSIGGT